MRLTLLLPQLIWPEPEDRTALERLPCPALEWLLAHGTASRRSPKAYEHILAEIFGFADDAPFGALRLLGESTTNLSTDAREGFWLCADPVHLRFHHERIILADAGAFELTHEEVHTLAKGLNQEFGNIGQFHVADTRRWYVRLNAATSFTALPLSAVAGRRVEGELPDQPHTSKLRSWLNEIQMFLHSHPVNAARASAGKPAVNSLWLWGAGTLPKFGDNNHDGVWSRDPLALGLARASGIPAHPLPQRLDSLLEHTAPESTQLIVLDDLLAPVLYEDSQGWRQALEGVEESWFAPLRSALGRQVKAVTLLAPTVYGVLAWEIKSADRWKFWRRPQSIGSFAKELAQ